MNDTQNYFERLKKKHICAECTKWDCGEFWGTNLNGGNHGVVVESQGFCCRWKKKRRPTWNYHPVCKYFDPREKTSFIYSGQGIPDEDEMNYIMENVEEVLNNAFKD